MLSISIEFTRPYLLLLLIAFYAMTVIPYFRLSKKYRKTRNRITSMVLHAVLSTLAVLLLAGTTFVRSKSNPENELILLVDVSDTENESKEARDKLVRTVVDQASYEGIKVGIVTFGYDQEYVSELSNDYDNIYDNYRNATVFPDQTATNIASAINYTKDLFTNPDSGKIVIVTDGKETDDNAKTVIRTAIASGLKIDTVYIPSSYEGDEIELTNVEYPEYHINKGEEFTLSLSLLSNYEDNITIDVYDNGVNIAEEQKDYSTVIGEQKVQFKHTFTSDGLHELSFKINGLSDAVTQNNDYTSYFYVESFNKILILEQNTGESNLLKSVLTAQNDFVVDVLNITTDILPESALALCAYDEVILNNISYSDLMDNNYMEIIHEYVYTYGGGLFTTGGTDAADTSLPHSYNREDIKGSLYQQMLPVQIINYTPPVGVIFILDVSGSMNDSAGDGSTLLDWAKEGVRSCLSSLTERDYIGIMTLSTDYGTLLELTPRTQESKILSVINKIDTADGSTTFSGAIERAGQMLRAAKNVDKKHIIIVSDGYTTEPTPETYEEFAKSYYETDGITISVVGVAMTTPNDADSLIAQEDPENIPPTTAYNLMLRLTKYSHGRLHAISTVDSARLVPEMREDLKAPDIQEVSDEPFYPIIVNNASPLFNGVERLNDAEHGNTMTMQVEGFYGAKLKQDATLLLTGEFNVPLYAQWKYGKGMVGSFMSDVYGYYTGDFMSDVNGENFLKNVVRNLTPVRSIRDNDIKLNMFENNYSNSLSILTNINEGEYINGVIKYEDKTTGTVEVSLNSLLEDLSKENLRKQSVYVTTPLTDLNNYSRCKFIIKAPGTYTIEINKYNEAGELIGSNSIHKTLAYSSEYEYYLNQEVNYREFLETLAKNGNGTLVEDLDDPHSIIDTFETVIYKRFDPRYLFAIMIIVLFLADVAVRKFKFKWPHEIIKKYRERRGSK